MKLLDCTLRDAGFYNDWIYSDKIVKQYCSIVNKLNIDKVEIGYRNPPASNYKGSLYYCPSIVLKKFDSELSKDIEKYLMIDFKNVDDIDLNINRIREVKKYIHGIRIALDIKKTNGLDEFTDAIYDLGLQVNINLMYGHLYKKGDYNFKEIENIINKEHIQTLSIVDSYGSLFPGDVKKLISLTKKYFPKQQLGYHGHNNLNLALTNSLAALESGVEVIDSTLSGLGRGAGNLRTEDSIIVLRGIDKDKDSRVISGLCDGHEMIKSFKEKYTWGPEIPYAIAGSKNIPQGIIMELMSLRRLSYLEVIDSSIVKHTQKIDQTADHKKLIKISKEESVLIVAGYEDNVLTQDIIDFLKSEYNLKKVYLCGANAIKLYCKLEIEKVCIAPGKEIEELSPKNNDLLFYQLHPLSDVKKYNTFKSNRTLNNPLEFIGNDLDKKKFQTIFIHGFTGDVNEFLTNESQNEFNLLKKKCSTLVSLMKTDYEIDTYSIYSEMS